MSFFKKPLLVLAMLPLLAHAQPNGNLSADDMSFIENAAAYERELSGGKSTESISRSVAEKLSVEDKRQLMGLQTTAESATKKLSPADIQMMEELQKATDKPMTAWLDQLEGTTLVTDNMRKIAAQETTQPNSKLDEDVRLLVFISLGMPEGTLRSYFSQAWDDRGVVFVIRGWEPPNFSKIVEGIRKLQPSMDMPPNVIIDPNLYREYDVTQVPMFLAMDQKKVWRRLYGEISLEGAEAEINNGKFHSKDGARLVGPTYAIAEPDILEEIEKRIAKYDWDAEIEGARKRAASFRPGLELPMSEKDEVYYVDPTFTLKEDILNPDSGEVIAAAGTKVNPLDTITLDKKYMVFDPESRGQMEMAKSFVGENPFSTLIATFLPDFEEGKVGLADALNAQIYTLNSQIVERFALKATPSVVEQEGRFLKVTVKRVPL